ncbi:TRIO and F-actin binding protein b isoform X2 [Oryzias melastigma]|uniref:TRIO and F-actin binding protein b isoform X2 n=1 Tax=Oryzias melastigma TaxID=30732 RepID=UPI000CF832A4|nr:TRIO and F-actin binding protein b isoform X2 [Oryzias melastigma]
MSLRGQSHDRGSSSPLKKSYEPPSQSLPYKPEPNGRIREGYSSASSRKDRDNTDPRLLQKSAKSSPFNGRGQSNPNLSPSGKGNHDPPGYSVLKTTLNGESSLNLSFQRKSSHSEKKYDSNRSPPTWHGSTSSIRSSSQSRASSPPKKPSNINRTTFETSRTSDSIRSGSGRHRHEDRSSSPSGKRFSNSARCPSPSLQIPMHQHTSSQSSMESSESSQVSAGSTGRNREEYITMADLPKIKMIHPREGPGTVGKSQSQQPVRRQELFKPASHSLSKHPSTDWEDTGDTEKEWHFGGYLSRAQSYTSLQRSGSPTADEGSSWKNSHHKSDQMQPDLLNFKKGWMSKLDDSGEWKKHWFVLTDAGLKYYRDLTAEEKDDLDGEIDLKSCVKVSEFNVEKNYGFQIQTREAVFTLSAMTAGIRRNWIEVLKKCIQPSSSPDLTQLPDNSSDKENSHAHVPLSSRHGESPSVISAPSLTQHRFDYVELSPVLASSSPHPASQREAGEGQVREQGRWQEEVNMSSQWEAVLSRKGSGKGSNPRLRLEEEIERKWAELERMPLKEVASLRQQLGQLEGGGGEGLWGGCGPTAPCSRSLAAMERAHQQALEELQKQHERQIGEMESEKERLLLEETQDTARVMEALKKKHKEDLEKVMEMLSAGLDPQALQVQQQAETQALKRELDSLSERYSQKCLELIRAEQINADREREVSRKERDMEQLRKENLDLKDRLKEEMIRVQSTGTNQSSEDDKDRIACELQVVLRMKDNEVEYLQKEMRCLRNELQFLSKEKQLACERFTEANVELGTMKVRMEREIQNLKEHLRLAMAALQEGQKLGNSLDH